MQTPYQDSWEHDSQSLGDPLHFCIQLQLIKTKLCWSPVKDACSWYTNPGEAPAAALKTLPQHHLLHLT